MDDGTILADGPSIALQELAEDSLKEWLGDFERFLHENLELINSAIAKL